MAQGLMMHLLLLILILPYFILLLNIYRYLFRVKPFCPVKPSRTFVSLVIACRDEQDTLPALLLKVSEQDFPREQFEVIVVDDNSTDLTKEAASRFSGSMDLKIISNRGSGKKTAIRTGIGRATGELIVTTDADCIPGPDWLKTIASFYELHKPDMIICPVRLEQAPEKTGNIFGIFQEIEFLSLQAVTAGTALQGNGTLCNGANLAFTKQAYYNNMCNLRFDIPTGDDVFLLHSLKKNKSRILWLESAEAIVLTESTPDISSFLKQRRRWASKSTAYKDRYSILLGIVTFVTILLPVAALIAGFFNPAYFMTFAYLLVIKSIPDFIILLNTTRRYGKGGLMKWFIPCQLIYPFYVLGTAGYVLLNGKRGKIEGS